MDQIFGNPLRETFRGGVAAGRPSVGFGNGLGNRILINRSINAPIDAPSYYFEQSDDEPLFFNWFRRV